MAKITPVEEVDQVTNRIDRDIENEEASFQTSKQKKQINYTTEETSKDVGNKSKLLKGRRNLSLPKVSVPTHIVTRVQSVSKVKLAVIGAACLLTLLVVIIVFASASKKNRSKYSSDEAEAIVALHNRYRKEVMPGPPIDTKELVWSDSLAETAQAWADGCKWKHGNPDWIKNVVVAEGKPIGKSHVGQNLFQGSSGVFNSSSAVTSWNKEAKDYDYDSATCRKGKMCGHYTQVVWASTNFVGCGWTTCRSEKAKDYIVCNYYPGGNYRGEQPYKLK